MALYNWILLVFSLTLYSSAYSQIIIDRNFNLELAEKDSLTSAALEESLKGFLNEARDGNYTSKYVDSVHLKQYDFFFRKLSGIGKDTDQVKFNNPNILKSYTPDGEIYYVTVSFSGLMDDKPFVFQVTELKMVPYHGHYRFYCRFKENTQHYKTKTFKNVTYYFSGSLNEAKASSFADFKDRLSLLTETPKSDLDYYAFQSLDDLLKAYGFLYSARQCNFLCYDLGFTDNGGQLYMTGTNNENYIFGYLGDYLYYNLPDKEDMYWPFVQGVSTYYGGYALSYDNLSELKQQFRKELKENPEIDFLVEFKKGRKSSVNRHFSYYVMSAFITEAVINEKDFQNVLKLVYSGKDGELFFENLQEILDVREADFHKFIVDIIAGY